MAKVTISLELRPDEAEFLYYLLRDTGYQDKPAIGMLQCLEDELPKMIPRTTSATLERRKGGEDEST